MSYARGLLGLVLGVSLGLGVMSASEAQELPTGAERLVEKVQTRVFISTAMLKYRVDAIVANHPTPGG